MKKIIALLLSLSLVVVMLAACGGSAAPATTAAPAETTAAPAGGDATEAPAETDAPASDIDFSEHVKLTWAISGAGGVGTAVANQKAIDMIAERSGGAIEIEFVTDGALGNEASTLQQVMEGSLDITGCAIGIVSGYSEYLSVFQMPFLINNYELEAEVLKSPEWQALIEAANKDLETATILGGTEFGMRGIATIDNPVTKMSDIAGLKVRTGGNPVIDQAMTLLGASPTPVPFTELYSALQNKVVDAEEINVTSVSMQKHYEVINYFTDIGLYPWLSLAVISNATIDRLPEGYYDLICECIAEADADYMQNELYNWVDTAQKDCEANNVQFSELTDKEEWLKLMDPLYDEWSEKDPLIADFISAVKDMDK